MQLIQAARNEGNFVVLCDYTDTNPGISISDKHYKVNYMDTDDEILRIVSRKNLTEIVL